MFSKGSVNYLRFKKREDPEQTSSPAAMMAILSPRRSASSILCVVMIIVLPVCNMMVCQKEDWQNHEIVNLIYTENDKANLPNLHGCHSRGNGLEVQWVFEELFEVFFIPVKPRLTAHENVPPLRRNSQIFFPASCKLPTFIRSR